MGPAVKRPNDNPAAVDFGWRGTFVDGWCGPLVSFRVGVNTTISICHLVVWFRPEKLERPARLWVDFDDADPFELDVGFGRTSHIQVACPGRAGDVLGGRLRCDHVLSDLGADRRILSYRLAGIGFT